MQLQSLGKGQMNAVPPPQPVIPNNPEGEAKEKARQPKAMKMGQILDFRKFQTLVQAPGIVQKPRIK